MNRQTLMSAVDYIMWGSLESTLVYALSNLILLLCRCREVKQISSTEQRLRGIWLGSLVCNCRQNKVVSLSALYMYRALQSTIPYTLWWRSWWICTPYVSVPACTSHRRCTFTTWCVRIIETTFLRMYFHQITHCLVVQNVQMSVAHCQQFSSKAVYIGHNILCRSLKYKVRTTNYAAHVFRKRLITSNYPAACTGGMTITACHIGCI